MRAQENKVQADRLVHWCTCALVPLSLVLWCAVALAAPPSVTNVWFSQRAGSNLVDIWYDVSDPDNDPGLVVSVQFSSDGGQTWPIVPRTTSGDIGPGQDAGKKKHVIWDAGRDYPVLKGSRFKARVTADDGVTVPPTADRQPPTVPEQSPTTGERPAVSGMRSLGRNSQGYEEYLWLKDSSVMVKIPAGTFAMGSNDGDADEKPVHQVYLDEYYIDKCEVTNRQYKQFCDATGKSYPSDPGFSGMSGYFTNYPDYPVVKVNWDDAQVYCTWAGKSLPTEVQWEKAARGTDGREYPWGNNEPTGRSCNWSRENWNDGYANTAPVGSFPAGASPYGCLDMAGNVWELCNDWYGDKYYSSSASNNPQGPSSGSDRVLRGGSWGFNAGSLRCANRNRSGPSDRFDGSGFRCAVAVAAGAGLLGPSGLQSAVDPDSLYNTAYLDFTRGKYQPAIAGFERFTEMFPTSDMADNAQYWIGESYYSLNEMAQAEAALKLVLTVYADGNKVPAAAYKLGLVYLAENRKDDAARQFRNVVANYPGTTEAKLAQERLQQER